VNVYAERERVMTTRRRWLWVAAALALVAAVIAFAFWLNVDWEDPTIVAKYDKIAIGMRLEDAESILGFQPVQESPKWDYESAPEILKSAIAQSGPWDSEDNYYVKSRYWIIISYNPSTKCIIKKELSREPGVLKRLHRRYFEIQGISGF
jgi:hypothetical protein